MTVILWKNIPYKQTFVKHLFYDLLIVILPSHLFPLLVISRQERDFVDSETSIKPPTLPLPEIINTNNIGFWLPNTQITAQHCPHKLLKSHSITSPLDPIESMEHGSSWKRINLEVLKSKKAWKRTPYRKERLTYSQHWR